MCYRSKIKLEANFPWDKPIDDLEKDCLRKVEEGFYRPAILSPKDVVNKQVKMIYWSEDASHTTRS